MRIQSSFWLLLTGVASAASQTAQVYILDPESSTHRPTFEGSVRPSTAKLILSRRLGFSDLYSLSGSDASVIQHIDEFGGPQQHVFSIGNKRHESRVFLTVEGVHNFEDVMTSSVGRLGRLQVNPAPHAEGTDQLLDEFMAEAERCGADNSAESFSSKALEKLSTRYGNKIVAQAGRTIVYVKSLTNTDKQYGSQSSEYREEIDVINQALNDIYKLDDSTVTILLTPPQKSTTKYAGSDSWGPKIQRRSESEAPLKSNPNTGTVKISPHRNNAASSPPPLDNKAIPSRYSSLDDCERTTKNCTGHGECRKLLSESVGGRVIDYYSCVCGSSVNNGSTTYYAGSACQKIDLTTPFWLLAGVTIFLLTVVSMGVGLLFSMGNEELPSVIGAGVTGPRAK